MANRAGQDMITGIHHLSIIVSSDESVKFYQKLGFKENKRIKRSYDTVVFMEGYGIGLVIFIDPSHPVRSTPEPLGVRQLALRVDRIEVSVEELGLEAGETITDWNGNRYVVIRDPDGNNIQLCE